MSNALDENAIKLESMLPRIMQVLFSFGHEDPLGDIPVSQLRMIRVLFSGSRTSSEIGEMLGMTPSATTQMANRLEKSGYIERVDDPADRRVKHLRLTAQAHQQMVTRRASRVDRAKRVLGTMNEEHQLQAIDLLENLYRAIEEFAKNNPNSAIEEDFERILPIANQPVEKLA